MKKNDFIFLLVSTTIMIFAWIIFNLIHISKTSTVTDLQNQQIQPIQPNFDTKTIDALNQRQYIDPLYQFQSTEASQTAIRTLPSLIPTPTISVVLSPPVASSEASPSDVLPLDTPLPDTQSPDASQGGDLLP